MSDYTLTMLGIIIGILVAGGVSCWVLVKFVDAFDVFVGDDNES
jgi:hypothetical protein